MYLSIDPEREVYIYIYIQFSSLARVALYNHERKARTEGEPSLKSYKH